MKGFLFLSIFMLNGLFNSFSQELSCNVIVNADQIKNSNKQVFTSLQTALNEFVNNRRWSDFQYDTNEKIECTFIIVVNEYKDNKFKTSLQVQARRPIFNSAYYTSLFNFKDENLNFEYLEMTPLEFTEGTFGSNLTAVIAYYCYLIIGFDGDSFEKMGGTSSFSKAESIVNSAQSQSEKGWKAFEDNRNRYALINHLLDDNLKKFREFFYEYHRLGLDEMYNDVSKGSAKIAVAIQVLRDVNRLRPSSVVLTSFLETKTDELVNIFSNASEKEKTAVNELLMDINPSQSTRYESIIKK